MRSRDRVDRRHAAPRWCSVYPLASSTPMEPPDARDNSPKRALTPASEGALLPPGKTTPSGPGKKGACREVDLPLDLAPAHQMTA